MLAGFFLRVWHLGTYDLWVDEAISYFIANRSPLDVVAYTMRNIAEHPPGYYILLHYWMSALGASEMALRLFSAFGGMVGLALLMMVARRWFGNGVALLAGLLFCVQPLALLLSRDARMYPWFAAAILLMVYLFDRAVHKPRPARWALFALAAAAALAINYLTVFVLLALALFAVVERGRLKQSLLPLGMILLVTVGLPLLWVALSPGPRGSIMRLLSEFDAAWTPARLAPIFIGWPLSQAGDNGVTPALVALAAFRWLLAIAGILWMVTPRLWGRRALRWLLALLIIVPPVAGSFLFVVVKQRYFSSVLAFFVLAIALGIVAAWRRSRLLGVVLALTLLLMDGQAALDQLKGGWRPFSAVTDHILSRAYSGETVVYTYFWDKFQDLYYNAARLPVEFVPGDENEPTVESAEAAAREVLQRTGSAWLVLFPSELKPEVVQAGFERAGYPTETTWFPGSRGALRYFAEQPLTERSSEMQWDNQFRLNRWWRPETTVAAGDAIRLQFEWQNLAPSPTGSTPEETALPLTQLTLRGPDGKSWAERVAPPCDGACQPAEWQNPALNRQALYVPLDVPPGRYTVEIAWLTSDGQPVAGRATQEGAPLTALPLFEVEVGEPVAGHTAEAPLARLSGATSADRSLTLVSAAPPEEPILAGSLIELPTQWRVDAAQPPLEARLTLTSGNGSGQLAQPLGPDWHPSQAWKPGRLIRAEPSFLLPASLRPGEYRMTLSVNPVGDEANTLVEADLGPLTIRDRDRRFDLPEIGQPVGVEWQEGITLARAAVPEEGVAGAKLPLTLIWQADRPTAGNWKVFVHLVGGRGVVRGYGDGYPLQGAALTPSWQHGEVLVDEHPIQLAPDMPPGEYRLLIGFYDEPTGQRLPLAPGVDTYEWPTRITITRP